ncbi:MAG: DUF4197 domain-containing protein [Burkholderiaceae bacterium]
MRTLLRIAQTVAISFALTVPVVGHAGLDLISNADATGALKLALEKGAGSAIANLGQAGGFLNNPKVRIPLPDTLKKTEKMIRLFGRGEELDQLTESMNRAAEAAVPKARDLMVESVRSMSVSDARKILSGGDDSVTQYFRERTSAPLQKQFLPVVTEQVSKLGIAQQYNALAGQGAKLGLVKGDATTIESYVTSKALDGLYAMIAEEEKAIRANPLKAGSSLLKKVFGAMK